MSSVNLEVSWSDIVAEFDKRYENSFSRSTAKAHLDFSNLTIDGPRHRWKHILLLDTLMCLFLGKEKKCEESNRRRFNQYRVLRECFVLVTSQALVNFQQKVDNMSSHRLMNSCELVNFPLEWKSNAILSKSLLSVGCSKSWNRIVSSVEDIFKKLGELSLEVNVLCQEVMNKLYIQNFIGSGSDNSFSSLSRIQKESNFRIACNILVSFWEFVNKDDQGAMVASCD